MFLFYGWARRSERLEESVPLNRGKNLSVLGAFGAEGMLAQTRKIGAMKRVDVGAHASVMQVERFLEFELLPKLPAGTVLVLDNAKIHKGGRIKEIVEAAGCSLLYLSPYTFAHLQIHRIFLPSSLPGDLARLCRGGGLSSLSGACVPVTRRHERKQLRTLSTLCQRTLRKPGLANADTV